MNAYDIIFDNISSSAYDLMIAYFEGEEPKENIVAEHEYNTYKSKFGDLKILDIEEKETREFDITLVRQTPIELYEIDGIYKWLMPKDTKFRKLYINDSTYQGYYYNCKISKIVNIPINGYSYAIKCTVICQSQYALSNIKKQTYVSPTLPLNFKIINDSSKKLTPIFKFKCNLANGNVSLKNNTTNETMTLTGMNINETITIDYKECQISSDVNALVLSKFNKKFKVNTDGSVEMSSGTLRSFQSLMANGKGLKVNEGISNVDGDCTITGNLTVRGNTTLGGNITWETHDTKFDEYSTTTQRRYFVNCTKYLSILDIFYL